MFGFCCKKNLPCASLWLIAGSIFIFLLDKSTLFKVMSLTSLALLLFIIIPITMHRNTNLNRWVTNIFLAVNIFLFALTGVFLTLAIKTHNFTYCFQTTGSLFKKIISEDLSFQNKLIPTTQLIYNHGKLIINLLLQPQNKEPIKLTKVLDYQVLHQNRGALHFLFNEIFIKNTYYFKAQTETPFIIDCGSNIGMSILYFKTLYPQAKILGFEPERTTFKILEKNIKANNLKEVTLLDQALSDSEENIQLYPADLVTSIFNTNHHQNSYTVKSTKLSAYITQPVDMLKIDIEGAETKVLQDLVQTKKLSLVKEIIMEYHHHLDDGKDYLSLTLKALEDNGFGYIINSERVTQPIRKKSYQPLIIYAYQK